MVPPFGFSLIYYCYNVFNRLNSSLTLKAYLYTKAIEKSIKLKK